MFADLVDDDLMMMMMSRSGSRSGSVVRDRISWVGRPGNTLADCLEEGEQLLNIRQYQQAKIDSSNKQRGALSGSSSDNEGNF